MGLPPVRENSWQAGLERLLLGYALPGDGKKVFKGVFPFSDIEGSATAVLGSFLEFVQALAAVVRFVNGQRTLAEWVEWLHGLLAEFFLPDPDSQGDLLAIEAALQELSRASALAACDRPMDIDVVEAAMVEKLAGEPGMPSRFLSGQVTFCALLPMRSIPFRIIALVGLNDGQFPRKSASMSFDLMARFPRRGDRSLRDEDKYLFLETLISARERLFISYLGRNIRDNSEIQPSIVVSELLAYLEGNYSMADSDQPLSALIHIRHPLQAFDPRYFRKDSPLFSYSRENLAALQAAANRTGRKDGRNKSLPLPEEGWQDIGLSQLLAFFHHPVRFFFPPETWIFLEEGSFLQEDRESFC